MSAAPPREDLVPTPALTALACGVLGGIAALLAFPPYDLWWLLPVAIALLVAGVLVRSAWLAALVSLLWGLAFFVPLTRWAETYAGAMPWAALAVFEALYIVLFGLLARAVLVRRGLRLGPAIVVAALWVAVETLRSHVPWGGLPWGASAFALADSPLLNLGPWIGTAGLSAVVALLAMLLLSGGLAVTGRRHRGLRGIAGVWPLAVAVAAVLATVVVPLPVNRAPEGRPTMTVAGIQGNMDPVEPATMAMPEGIWDNHLQVTEETVDQAAAEGRELDLIVWPEDSTEYDPRQDAVRSAQLTAVAAEAGAPVLVGTQTLVGEDQRLNNSLLYTPGGSVPYVYSKRHPVPFGEFIPMRGLFRMVTDKVDLVGRDMIAGDEVGVMDLELLDQGDARVGVLICFEIAYENLVQDVVDGGAEVIVVQSNNALFGESDEAIQQLAESEVLAVVSGRSIVHVSTVGHSAIITPEGKQLAFVDHWQQGSVVAEVPLRTGITPAVAAGPWIAIGICALALAGLLGAHRGPRQGLQREPAPVRGRGREGRR